MQRKHMPVGTLRMLIADLISGGSITILARRYDHLSTRMLERSKRSLSMAEMVVKYSEENCELRALMRRAKRVVPAECKAWHRDAAKEDEKRKERWNV